MTSARPDARRAARQQLCGDSSRPGLFDSASNDDDYDDIDHDSDGFDDDGGGDDLA